MLKTIQKKRKTKKQKIDRTLGKMAETKLYRQNHMKKHTHTNSQREKRKNNIYIYIKKKEESNQINKQIYQ